MAAPSHEPERVDHPRHTGALARATEVKVEHALDGAGLHAVEEGARGVGEEALAVLLRILDRLAHVGADVSITTRLSSDEQ